MMGIVRRAGSVAPDISAYRGQSGRGVVKAQAAECLDLLRHGGIGPGSTIAGEGVLGPAVRMALAGYRAVGDEASVRVPLESWASASLNGGRHAGILLDQRSGRLTCTYVGLGLEALRCSLPDARRGPDGPGGRALPFQAVVLGVPADRVDYDAALDAAGGSDACVEALLLPSHGASEVMDELSRIRGVFEPYRDSPLRAGANAVSVREVADLLDLCDRMTEDLNARPQRARLVFRVSAAGEGALDAAVAVCLLTS